MISGTYPITNDWLREDKLNSLGNKIVSRKLNSLFIGNETSFQLYYAIHYRIRRKAADFKSAKNMLECLIADKENLPDVILIDTSLNSMEFREFCTYLKRNVQLSVIPILYNSQRLTSIETAYLLKESTVDDIIDFSETGVDYSGKVAFLKKIKKFSGHLQLNKEYQAEPKSSHLGINIKAKRIFDILISSLLIICCLPLFILIALAIKFESRGPVFYTSLRAGKGFKIFHFFKFRTMEVDADKKIDSLTHLNKYKSNEKGARFLKIYDDPRVTRVGRFLRKTSLDELPQFFNVLKGDMSIVGNRPLPIYEAATLTTNEFAERFMAPAGITGLWQIKKKTKPDMSAEERISLDITYARSNSFLSDIRIIAKTPSALIQKSHL